MTTFRAATASGLAFGAAFSALALTTFVGCTSVEVVKPYAGEPLPRPDRLLVHLFAFSPSQVKLLRGIEPEIARSLSKTPPSAKQLELGAKVAHVLQQHLVRDLRALGLPAEAAAGDPLPFGNTYSLRGQFVSIDEGDRTERVLVGLGLGRSDVETYVQLYRDSAHGRPVVEALEVDAKSGRKPGIAEMLPAGALVTGALIAAAVVSSGTAMGAEIFSADVEADARRTARKVAEEIAKLSRKQGWVAETAAF